MSDSIRLDGKVAVVSGAGRGLGRAMALALAEAGARVVGADILGDNMRAVAGEARALTNVGGLTPITADIRQPADCRRIVDTALDRFGAIDILVNNASVLPAFAYPGRLLDNAPPSKFWNLSEETVQTTLETNFIAHDRMTRYVVPQMVDRGWGRVVNVTTRLSTMHRTGGSPYGPAKAALEMASEIWMKDLDGTGVTVNILNPGAAADTPGFASDEEKRQAVARRKLFMMHPDQMRAPIVWLVSTATDGINGMRYDAVSWDAARPAAEQARLHGRPLGFDLKPKPHGDGAEARDDAQAAAPKGAYRPAGA